MENDYLSLPDWLCLEEGIILGIADGKVKERLLRENELTLENMVVILPAWEISHVQIKNVNELSDLDLYNLVTCKKRTLMLIT